MRWFRRREPGRHAASVPQPAAVVVTPTAAAPIASPAPIATPAPVAAPVPVAAGRPEGTAGVLLGFHDGSEVQLAAGDPRAQALRAVADVLLHGGPA